ncbi:hypothetical protein [Mesorhizobium japonicum]|uniref:hypothetical protein n=1 Tax=Mesorhizobium japonicum TaxID=2066070 RepID=UPI003B5CD4A3
MANVYVEPLPKGSTAPITGYKLEYAGGQSVDGVTHRTQETAIAEAKRLGHSPLVARVRVTDKGKPDHWRAA